MKISLLHYTPLDIAVKAIRTCYNSQSDNMGCKDTKLLESIIKNKHLSTIEHLYMTFEITGISRACLQELARHRIASYSVRSTRYTLRELKDERSFLFDKSRASKYLVLTGIDEVDNASIQALDNLRKCLQSNTNDVAKYALPESYKTNLVWTINARSLRNFLELRMSSRALKEIQELARNILLALPKEYELLFKDINGGEMPYMRESNTEHI